MAFSLIGTALLLSEIRGRAAGLILSACATAVLLLVLAALLGYLYMVTPLTGVLGFTQVSIPTAVALGGLSIGVLALRPDDGWVRLLISNSVGATAARWLLPTVVIVPLLVASLALRGSEAGLYPADFRLAFTTAVTIVLLAGLALWGAWQLDRLVTVRRMAERLRESEATLRAFFETEGLLASILERRGDDIRYLAANTAFARLYGYQDIAGHTVHELEPAGRLSALIDRIGSVAESGVPLAFEHAIETHSGIRWFAVTISPVAGNNSQPPRFATAGFEITERKHAEAQQSLLLQELNHRVKNTLAVVQSLAQQSFRGGLADPGARNAFEARLMAVAAANNLLVKQDWKSASMRALAGDVVGPGCGADPDRIDLDGPDIWLQPNTAVSIALALHELCTNAVKYGALSDENGRVSIRWAMEAVGEHQLCVTWQESGGPAVVRPTERGFGTRMIERALASELGAPVALEFHASGLVCTIRVNVASERRI